LKAPPSPSQPPPVSSEEPTFYTSIPTSSQPSVIFIDRPRVWASVDGTLNLTTMLLPGSSRELAHRNSDSAVNTLFVKTIEEIVELGLSANQRLIQVEILHVSENPPSQDKVVGYELLVEELCGNYCMEQEIADTLYNDLETFMLAEIENNDFTSALRRNAHACGDVCSEYKGAIVSGAALERSKIGSTLKIPPGQCVLNHGNTHGWSKANCALEFNSNCCAKNGRLRCHSSPKSCGAGPAEEGLCDRNRGCPDGKKCCKDSNDRGHFCCIDENESCPETFPLKDRERICFKEVKRKRKKKNRRSKSSDGKKSKPKRKKNKPKNGSEKTKKQKKKLDRLKAERFGSKKNQSQLGSNGLFNKNEPEYLPVSKSSKKNQSQLGSNGLFNKNGPEYLPVSRTEPPSIHLQRGHNLFDTMPAEATDTSIFSSASLPVSRTEPPSIHLQRKHNLFGEMPAEATDADNFSPASTELPLHLLHEHNLFDAMPEEATDTDIFSTVSAELPLKLPPATSTGPQLKRFQHEHNLFDAMPADGTDASNFSSGSTEPPLKELQHEQGGLEAMQGQVSDTKPDASDSSMVVVINPSVNHSHLRARTNPINHENNPSNRDI